jgi:negative regulator of sigma E activity
MLVKARSEEGNDAESSEKAAGMSVGPTQLLTPPAAGGQHSVSAAASLVRAITAPTRVNYSAWQQVVIRGPGGVITQHVRVVHRIPDDNRWEYFAGPGQVERVVVDDGQVAWQHLPRQQRVIYAPCVRANPDLYGDRYVERLAENYSLTAAGRQRIAGRPAVLLVLAPRDGHVGPTKWLWVDEQSGVVLRSQTRSADGRITVASTLSDVRFAQMLPDREFSPPMGVTRQSVLLAHAVALPLEALAREWGQALLVPGALPAGYLLESARFVQWGREPFIHVCYSDGLNTISLFETAARPARASGAAARADQVHGSPITWGGRGPFRALSWQEQGLSLMLVGDLPSDEMLRLARGVHRAP